MSDSNRISFSTAKRRAGWLVILFLVAGSIAYPTPINWVLNHASKIVGTTLPTIKTPFVLGLDLEGGTRLEYQADLAKVATPDQRDAMNGVRDVIERRVNSMGVSEPLVQTTQAGSAWRVIVELAGVKDVNQAVKMIGATPILEFKTKDSALARELTADEQKQITTQNQQAHDRAAAILADAQKPGADFATLAAQSDVASSTRGDIGYLLATSTDPVSHEVSALLPVTEYSDVYKAVSQLPTGTVFSQVIQRDHSFAVAKVTESVPTGAQEHHLSHILISYKDASAASGLSTLTRAEALAKINDLKKQVTTANFAEMAKKYSQEPSAAQTGGDLDWVIPGETVKEFETPAFAQATGTISDVVETPFGFHLIYSMDVRAQKNVRVSLIELNRMVKTDIVKPSDGWADTKLTGKQLQSAKLEFDPQTHGVQVALQFDDEGTKLFADMTRTNLGKPIAIFLDGQSISEPVVQSEIIGGRAVITGSYTVQEAKVLAQRLQAGALPVPIHLIAQQTVGPTLGADSLYRSLRAGLAGFILVAIFMILLYRIPGIVSIVALVLYAAMTAAIFKLIPVTMTLAGIAGFILSMGIAVDANVLAFERLKEEWKTGKTMHDAFEESFRRAWPSIRDGHVTVLISAVVLYGFSSSIIRGFALTLGIGTLLSLFTAVVSTRTMMRFLAYTPLRKLSWWFLKSRDSV